VTFRVLKAVRLQEGSNEFRVTLKHLIQQLITLVALLLGYAAIIEARRQVAQYLSTLNCLELNEFSVCTLGTHLHGEVTNLILKLNQLLQHRK